jgi:hypothetical protein
VTAAKPGWSVVGVYTCTASRTPTVCRGRSVSWPRHSLTPSAPNSRLLRRGSATDRCLGHRPARSRCSTRQRV